VGQDPGDPRAFVGDPVDLGLTHRGGVQLAGAGKDPAGLVAAGHARVVQGDDLPLVVVDRRARGARRGVGLVVHKPLQDVDEPVVAQGQRLGLAAGVLDDVEVLAFDRLAFLADEPAPPHPVEGGPVGSAGLDGDQGVVQGRVGDEQGVGVEPEGGGLL
jgi:hypothetical protein